MERFAMKMLVDWKARERHKPMLIYGARQVGKSWLMKEFGKLYFSKTVYIDFTANDRMKEAFSGNLEPNRLKLVLETETGTTITPGDTLIILDEIQEVPRALTSLKYFCEDAPEYYIVAAGSLMGVALHPGTSFPVGKVERMNLYPLSFPEYLYAWGDEMFLDIMQSKDNDLINTFRECIVSRLREYFIIGGMPEAVAAFIEGGGFNEVRNIQKSLIEFYRQDFSKHAAPGLVPRLNQVWDSIVPQLTKENRKFIFGQVRKGARAKDYELAIQWLLDAGLIHKVNVVKKPGIPLAGYSELNIFKLFLVDVGLFSAMSDLDIRLYNTKNTLFTEFKGALAEQYVHQQLISALGIKPYYYSADNSRGELDFLLQAGDGLIPVEVKAEENLQSKSLRAFKDKYAPLVSIRLSMSNYREQDWMVNIPLYDIYKIEKLIRERKYQP